MDMTRNNVSSGVAKSVTALALMLAGLGAALPSGCATQPPENTVAMNQNQPPRATGGETPQPADSGTARTAPAAPSRESVMIHFAFDSSAVAPGYQRTLAQEARFLANHPKQSVILEGYADERGSADYNMKLGLRRATAVGRLLEQAGVARDRVQLVSYGEGKPLAGGHNEAAWRKNRRVEIHFSPTAQVVSTLPIMETSDQQ